MTIERIARVLGGVGVIGLLAAGSVLLQGGFVRGAWAQQISDAAVRIGVLTDESGNFSALSGAGSVVAAKMAVEDFGGKVKGKPIEVIDADHQNKTDLGLQIARQ